MTSSNKIKILCCLFTILILSACTYESREAFNLDSLPENISFETDILPRFVANNPKCTQCHNGATPPNLTSEDAFFELSAGGYLNVDVPEESKLYKAIDGGSMDQYATDEDKAFILEWIRQGALEN